MDTWGFANRPLANRHWIAAPWPAMMGAMPAHLIVNHNIADANTVPS